MKRGKRRRAARACAALAGAALIPLAWWGLRQEPLEETVPQEELPFPAAALGMVLDSSEGEGLYLLAVMERSLAQDAGMEAGDRLCALNGVPLTSGEELDLLLLSGSVEPPLTFQLERGDDALSLTLLSDADPEERRW